jgi:hypothetical protein
LILKISLYVETFSIGLKIKAKTGIHGEA